MRPTIGSFILGREGGGVTSAGRSVNFDSFSEIGYGSPYVFRIISEDQQAKNI